MYGDNTAIGKLAKGESLTKDVETKAGIFTIKYPTGSDFRLIALKKAQALGGLPLESFSASHLNIVDKDVTLAVLIVGYPAGFPERFQGDGICDYPDMEVKDFVYAESSTFYQATQEEISGNTSESQGDSERGVGTSS